MLCLHYNTGTCFVYTKTHTHVHMLCLHYNAGTCFVYTKKTTRACALFTLQHGYVLCLHYKTTWARTLFTLQHVYVLCLHYNTGNCFVYITKQHGHTLRLHYKTIRARVLFTLQNNTGTYFAYVTMALTQLAGLSKEVCLYADADWLKLT